MERFIPDGFVAAEIATLVLARRSDPKLWSFDSIPAPELRIWLGINVHFDGLVLGPALFAERHVEVSKDAYDRLQSFEAALKELRQDLYKGTALAYFVDYTGELVSFDPKCWGQEPADEALASGKASIGDPPTQRLLLIKMAPHQVDERPQPEKKAGRKKKLNPQNVREAVFALMDEHGDFVVEDLDWNAQARLEEAVLQELGDPNISESTLRKAIAPHLEAWRSKKAENRD